jgi:hypothetical protein
MFWPVAVILPFCLAFPGAFNSADPGKIISLSLWLLLPLCDTYLWCLLKRHRGTTSFMPLNFLHAALIHNSVPLYCTLEKFHGSNSLSANFLLRNLLPNYCSNNFCLRSTSNVQDLKWLFFLNFSFSCLSETSYCNPISFHTLIFLFEHNFVINLICFIFLEC